jgi:hypothetical protein
MKIAYFRILLLLFLINGGFFAAFIQTVNAQSNTGRWTEGGKNLDWSKRLPLKIFVPDSVSTEVDEAINEWKNLVPWVTGPFTKVANQADADVVVDPPEDGLEASLMGTSVTETIIIRAQDSEYLNATIGETKVTKYTSNGVISVEKMKVYFYWTNLNAFEKKNNAKHELGHVLLLDDRSKDMDGTPAQYRTMSATQYGDANKKVVGPSSLDVPALREIWGDQIMNITGVGGIVITVDKFVLLAPYIGLTSTIIVTAVATVVYVKRVKRRKEKQ